MEKNIIRFKTNSIGLYNYLIPSFVLPQCRNWWALKIRTYFAEFNAQDQNKPCRSPNSDGFHLGGGKRKAASKASLNKNPTGAVCC